MQPFLREMELDFEPLRGEKNLLAFSGGVDSSALFYLLIEAGIPFDLALVNYHSRSTSNEEAAFAQKLASTYGKTVYIHDAALNPSNAEAQARAVRYDFFEQLIAQHGYTALLTAHQLNDQLEWLLMQLSKGAGLLELLGMHARQKKSTYTHYRPLLHLPKSTLYDYLHAHHYHYFEDESNASLEYTRNRVRHAFATPLIEAHAKGIAKSMELLSQDSALLLGDVALEHIQGLIIITASHMRGLLFTVDKELKKQGYMLSSAQREAIEKSSSVTIGGKFHVEVVKNKAYIVPVIEGVIMPKTFKEACRKARVPLKIRSFLFVRGIDLTLL